MSMKSAVSYLKKMQLKENSQGLLAKYILEHKDQIKQMTVRELAEQAYVSTASATRLAKGYGCSGYSEFKYELNRELKALDEFQNKYPNETVDNYICINIKMMRETAKLIDDNLIDELVSAILNSNELIIFAAGASLLRAMDFEYKLRTIGVNVISCMDYNQQLSQSKIITDSTSAIAISYSGDTEHVINCVSNLISNHRDCFYMSSSNIFGDSVKYIKLTDCEAFSTNYTIVPSASITFVLDLIFLELIKRNPEQFNNNLEATNQ